MGYILRSVGIPTRLVGGYLGGTYNPTGDYVQVRQMEAHVWLEVWLGQGWQRIDPTAAVAPDRIEMNLDTLFRRSARRSATAVPNGVDQPIKWAESLLGLDVISMAGVDSGLRQQRGQGLVRVGLWALFTPEAGHRHPQFDGPSRPSPWPGVWAC